MKILKLIWDQLYGLLVDDGQMAAGALIIQVVCGLVGLSLPEEERAVAGFLFLGLVCALVIVNLYKAGRNAAAKNQGFSHSPASE